MHKTNEILATCLIGGLTFAVSDLSRFRGKITIEGLQNGYIDFRPELASVRSQMSAA